jgi:hypothetical protein
MKSPLQPLFEANKALLVPLIELNQVRKFGIVKVSVCNKRKFQESYYLLRGDAIFVCQIFERQMAQI